MRSRAQRLLLAALILLLPFPAWPEPVGIRLDGTRLNGELVRGERSAPLFLLVHGSLAHHRMELMQGLQEALREQGFGSLAVTFATSVLFDEEPLTVRLPAAVCASPIVNEIAPVALSSFTV